MSRRQELLALLAAVVALGVVGCDRSQQGSPTTPLAPVFGLAPLAVGDAAAAGDSSVTGFWQFIGFNTHNDFEYAVSAIHHADGSVTGQFEERVLDPAGAFLRQTHGYVTCVQIEGNLARIGGVLTRVDAPNQPHLVPGVEFHVDVVDNGPPSSDTPDLGSNARFGLPGTAEAFCETGEAFNLEPVVHGNITIHP